ncbi:voltage-dependent P/Q-type calcium channel subunit alpha-1A-like protein [Lates japonicus]|uniref:Voltage-dependent P/Q-type calcium channel subunit alpha-1A-like protein n=1 Tax=Lates japonicus TaxID=270547 RepID=A0AAD3MVK5_LATJO|nr:voltage-dependent P/Q-type calcium channel subunit alpha-1A-like protein [Lates japonicus]
MLPSPVVRKAMPTPPGGPQGRPPAPAPRRFSPEPPQGQGPAGLPLAHHGTAMRQGHHPPPRWGDTGGGGGSMEGDGCFYNQDYQDYEPHHEPPAYEQSSVQGGNPHPHALPNHPLPPPPQPQPHNPHPSSTPQPHPVTTPTLIPPPTHSPLAPRLGLPAMRPLPPLPSLGLYRARCSLLPSVAYPTATAPHHPPHISMDRHILGLARSPLQLGIPGCPVRACMNPTARPRTTTGASLWRWGRGIRRKKRTDRRSET